jgi:hypothetical protein
VLPNREDVCGTVGDALQVRKVEGRCVESGLLEEGGGESTRWLWLEAAQNLGDAVQVAYTWRRWLLLRCELERYELAMSLKLCHTAQQQCIAHAAEC